MAEISPALVKQLREVTGAGMMDCKKALAETGANLEQAQDWLRKKGLVAAAKKASRVASEGLVGLAVDGAKGVVVEVNSETDFVARNNDFQQFVTHVTKLALSSSDIEQLKQAKYPQSKDNVANVLTALVAKIGENISLRRQQSLSVKKGIVASYVHASQAAGLGKIGVLLGIESAAPAKDLKELGDNIAMHIAAMKPVSVEIASLDKTLVERERAILLEQAKNSGQTGDILNKVVEGRLRKFYEDTVLLEQVYVVDGKTKISKLLEDLAAKLKTPVKITGFIRMALGEGIEKEDKDFAAEVAAQLGR